jgi:uncharacterized caspase-like protein
MRGLVVLLLALAAAWPAHARRLALVVGNDNYQKIAKLDRAGADAEAIAKELSAAGFEVSLYRDLTNTRFAVVVSEFYDKVKKGDEVVVFYAGHGVQTERGAQLLPVDIEGDTEFVIERLSQPVNGLLDSLERLQTRVSVVIIDACRDNPLRAQGRPIGASRGLSGPNVARGQMLIFSAASRERALDSLGKDDKDPNGVFTRELVSRMRTPGASFETVAKQVQESVERLAARVNHKQRPLIVNDSIGDFAFYPQAGGATAAPTVAVAPPDPSIAQAARENRFWDGVIKADTIEGYQAYLKEYPNGEYAAVAQINLKKLTQPARPPAVVVAQNTRGAGGDPAAVAQPPAGPGAPGLAVAPGVPPSAAPLPGAGAVPSVAPPAAPAPTPAASPAAVPPAGAPKADPLQAPSPSPQASAPTATAAPAVRQQASYSLANGDRYTGEVLANQRSGKGVYQFANGDRYEGEFANDQFMGRGVMTFANGDRYEGQFVGTTKQGQGVMVFANKDRYEGQFADNLYSGQGTFTFASGERYTGSYERGIKQGQGEQLFANKDRYVGPFLRDKPNGKGKTFHANGDVYEGDFVDGVKQGNGIYKFSNGDRYEGDFAEGLFSGKGRLYLSSGDRYEGEFRNNLKEGLGVHYFANKDRYEGGFKGGVQHGSGTHFFANGDRYVGEFLGGVRNGKGVHHFAGGQTREMEYVNGVEKAQ